MGRVKSWRSQVGQFSALLDNDNGGHSALNGLVKYVIGPDAYVRARAAGADPASAADSSLDSYADNKFAYTSTGKVSDEWVQGGTVHDLYAYFTNITPPGTGYDNWKYGTQETLPDGSTDTSAPTPRAWL